MYKLMQPSIETGGEGYGMAAVMEPMLIQRVMASDDSTPSRAP